MIYIVWLRSKITAPRTTLEAVGRPRLVDSLQYNELRKLTIVRAPAGYGKTTLLSQLISQLEEPVAWLSIDANDNDPIRFWTYVIRSVSNIVTKDEDSKVITQFNVQSPLEWLIDSFLNEIALVQERIVIVMDDYHLIESPIIHTMMARFIDYLPGNIRLLIASRTDLPLPFAEWRVQESLTEIGVDQLRFTYEEAELFYKKRRLDYEDTESLKRLMQMTEGWAAGIQLAVLSGGISAEVHSVSTQLNSKYPFITEFLLQEIFAPLSSSEQDFLVRTSILKQLEPAICDAITNRTDSHNMLLEFEKKGLFIFRLHSDEPVFRYHHLFEDALKIELHHRYSQKAVASFYEEVTMILFERGDIVSAIELLLRGQLWAEADKWISVYLIEVFELGQVSAFIRWVQVLRNHHYLVNIETLVMYMIALSNIYEIEKARRLIDELELRNEVDQWMETEEYEGIASIFVTAKAFVIFAGGGAIELAKALITTQLKVGRVSSKWDHIPMQYNQLEARTLRTSIGGRGKLWPKEVVMPFLDLFRQTEFKEQNMTGFGYGVQAETLYEHDDIDEALIELETALQYGHRFQDPGLYIPMYILKSRIYAMRKMFVDAYSILDYAMSTIKEQHWIDLLRVMKAYCYLLEGNVSQAEWELSKSTGLDYLQAESENEFWLLVHVRLLLAKGQAGEALKTTIRIKEKALQERQVSTIIEAGVLEAVCQMRLSNEDAALVALHGALKYGEIYNYKRTFLDEVSIEPLMRKYLKVHQKGIHDHWDFIPLVYIEQVIVSNQHNQVMDTLRPREREILRLLADGASNREIASKLTLTEGTVRIYLSEIYSKLGVNSRTKAILAAREE
ncbi:LuxR C-terminal-related transcriptional regulator [Sporosarcina sp.]|uniref:LuxR C-terminal-related transcriptional regulator n=1 Tax=Sporosarcina sp. TaxID=49982 RepID=UPI00261A9D77|nr:LuxR C-terminal-related transcriptional regulator [Sporosarcina sp.]